MISGGGDDPAFAMYSSRFESLKQDLTLLGLDARDVRLARSKSSQPGFRPFPGWWCGASVGGLPTPRSSPNRRPKG
jgi:hypothetical protein